MLTRRAALASLAATSALAAPATLRAQTGITWKYAHGGPVQHPSHLMSVDMARRVKDGSGGRFVIEVFPDRQLGEEKDLLEGVQLGSIDGSYLSTGPTGNIVPEFNVIDIPFLFKDAEHAYRVFDGPIGQELLAKFKPKGVAALAIWENGWRHLTTKKPVATVDDLRGMKLRTMANQVHIDAFRMLGAGAVPMAWGEVYTALEQGVIDAQENPLTAIAANSLWEVQRVLTLTGHVYGPHVVMFSNKSMDKLPEDMKALLVKTIADLTPMQRQLSKKLEADALQQLKDKGMQVNTIDREAIRAKLAPLQATYEKRFGREMLDRIAAASAAA